MLGDKALELIRESARTPDSLIPFNEDLVRQVLEEIRWLWDENCREVNESSVVSPSVTLRQEELDIHSGLRDPIFGQNPPKWLPAVKKIVVPEPPHFW